MKISRRSRSPSSPAPPQPPPWPGPQPGPLSDPRGRQSPAPGRCGRAWPAWLGPRGAGGVSFRDGWPAGWSRSSNLLPIWTDALPTIQLVRATNHSAQSDREVRGGGGGHGAPEGPGWERATLTRQSLAPCRAPSPPHPPAVSSSRPPGSRWPSLHPALPWHPLPSSLPGSSFPQTGTKTQCLSTLPPKSQGLCRCPPWAGHQGRWAPSFISLCRHRTFRHGEKATEQGGGAGRRQA